MICLLVIIINDIIFFNVLIELCVSQKGNDSLFDFVSFETIFVLKTSDLVN